MPASKKSSSKSSASPKDKGGVDFFSMNNYDYSTVGASVLSVAGLAMAVISGFMGNEWWHIKRPHTEIWIGLKKTCYNWRGSYDCGDNLYEDFERDGCSVAGSAVQNRHNVVFYSVVVCAVLSAISAVTCFAVVAKFRVNKNVIRGATAASFVALVFSTTAVAVFFQTQTGFAFCEDYCSYAEGQCVSEHGLTMRFAIAGCVANFLALLLMLFKNFDHRLELDDEDLEAIQNGALWDGKSVVQAASIDSDDDNHSSGKGKAAAAKSTGGRASSRPPLKTLPGPRGRGSVGGGRGGRGASSTMDTSADWDDGNSDADTIPARAPVVRKNPIRSAIYQSKAAPTVARSAYYEEDEDAALEVDEAEDCAPAATWDEPEEAAAAGVEAPFATDGYSDVVWDEAVGMYWNSTRQLHWDAASGHFYDAASNSWCDPSSGTDVWYQV